jgi:thiol-disulfide isomerase/thioredoxin
MKLIFFLFIAVLLNSCCDCDKSKEDAKPVVTGKMTWQEWQTIAQWESYNANNYKPNENLINQLKTLLSTQQNITFIMISASWCPDSETEVPKYYKLIELCEFDESKISLYGVDREKKEPTGTSKKYKIEKVPTLIILKDMVEIGRIVEFPVLSWEDDLITILETDK